MTAEQIIEAAKKYENLSLSEIVKLDEPIIVKWTIAYIYREDVTNNISEDDAKASYEFAKAENEGELDDELIQQVVKLLEEE